MRSHKQTGVRAASGDLLTLGHDNDNSVQRHERMCFTDCGASFLRGWETSGGIQCEGFTYIMRKL